MENVIVVNRDEKDNTIAPLKLSFLLLGYPNCHLAVRKTVLIKGHNELELKNPGQVFHRSSADSSKMFFYTVMPSSLS